MKAKRNKIKFCIHKTQSFNKAKKWEDKYYALFSFEERLSAIQNCRENYFKLTKIDASRKRFRRIFKVIKQISG
ncbi:MAG: hypothetical protein NC935_07090 [Candidatus Omnitrophica bacterium]|nr:hypothetical protein [Candidatus Omnitrophota bacterium]